MTPPLSGAALEILARLNAGQPVDHITEVGRYRTAWTRADVEAIAATWHRADRNAPDRREHINHPGPPRGPIHHGEFRGYQAHQRRGIPTTPDCGCDAAATQFRRDRKRTA